MKKIALMCVCMAALTVSSGSAGMRFATMPGIVLDPPQETIFLKSQNDALSRALEAHNLLNEIPELEDMAQSCDLLDKSSKLFSRGFKNLKKCAEKTLGGNYKNSGEVVDKAVEAYRKESKKVDAEVEAQSDPNSIIPPSVTMRDQIAKAKKKIGRGIFSDIAKNPSKYGAELIDKKAQAKMVQKSSAEESELEQSFNVLEELSKASDTMYNIDLGKEDIMNARKQITEEFARKLAAIGLKYDGMDLMQRGNLRQVREDLLKVKKAAMEEAEAYIAKLDEQDAKYPDLAAKRAYRSANKQALMAGVRKEFPESMKELVQIDQMSPQQQQKLVMVALKKDMNGTVYLTETNAMEIDRRMDEMDAHQDMMKHLKKYANDFLPADIPEFDFSICKA